MLTAATIASSQRAAIRDGRPTGRVLLTSPTVNRQERRSTCDGLESMDPRRISRQLQNRRLTYDGHLTENGSGSACSFRKPRSGKSTCPSHRRGQSGRARHELYSSFISDRISAAFWNQDTATCSS